MSLYAAITPVNFEAATHAKKLNLPLIAIEDALFIDRSDSEVHKVLRAMALKKTVGSLTQAEYVTKEHVFHTKEEYERIFSPWPTALTNSERIASICRDIPLFSSFVFPNYQSMNKNNAVELRERVLKGAHIRYGEISDGIMDRIEYELSIINKKGFAPTFSSWMI